MGFASRNPIKGISWTHQGFPLGFWTVGGDTPLEIFVKGRGPIKVFELQILIKIYTMEHKLFIDVSAQFQVTIAETKTFTGKGKNLLGG